MSDMKKVMAGAATRMGVTAAPFGGEKLDTATINKMITETADTIRRVVIEKLVKQGVPRKWMEDQLKEQVAEYRKKMGGSWGRQFVLKRLKDWRDTYWTADDVLQRYNRSVDWETSKGLHDAGRAIATDPKKKIELLTKLGLNGPEFVAFCMMVKEQIR